MPRRPPSYTPTDTPTTPTTHLPTHLSIHQWPHAAACNTTQKLVQRSNVHTRRSELIFIGYQDWRGSVYLTAYFFYLLHMSYQYRYNAPCFGALIFRVLGYKKATLYF